MTTLIATNCVLSSSVRVVEVEEGTGNRLVQCLSVFFSYDSAEPLQCSVLLAPALLGPALLTGQNWAEAEPIRDVKLPLFIYGSGFRPPRYHTLHLHDELSDI